MVPGALISGRVRDAAGRPQSNVNVQVFTISYQTNQPILQPVAAKTTDDRGEYRLFWLKPGEYFVAATPRQGAGGTNNNPAGGIRQIVLSECSRHHKVHSSIRQDRRRTQWY